MNKEEFWKALREPTIKDCVTCKYGNPADWSPNAWVCDRPASYCNDFKKWEWDSENGYLK